VRMLETLSKAGVIFTQNEKLVAEGTSTRKTLQCVAHQEVEGVACCARRFIEQRASRGGGRLKRKDEFYFWILVAIVHLCVWVMVSYSSFADKPCKCDCDFEEEMETDFS
jgi:hypothetical protein